MNLALLIASKRLFALCLRACLLLIGPWLPPMDDLHYISAPEIENGENLIFHTVGFIKIL
jgi:hypothetical protein